MGYFGADIYLSFDSKDFGLLFDLGIKYSLPIKKNPFYLGFSFDLQFLREKPFSVSVGAYLSYLKEDIQVR